MPADHGWSQMWTAWNPIQINKAFSRIAGLGGTSVRAVVQPFALGWPLPTGIMRQHFAQFIQMASRHGLTVQVTLFDLFGNYSQISQSRAFVRSLLSPYANSTAISFVEVQNEISPTNQAAVDWLRELLPYTKSVVGSIPVTVSTSGSVGLAGLASIKQDLAADPPDFYDYHYYGTAGDAYQTLAKAQKIAAPVPLMVGETGISTISGAPSPNTDNEQAQFFYAVASAATDLHLPPVGVWTLSDFTEAGLLKGLPAAEQYFGLYQTDGKPKPAAAVVRTEFRSRPRSTVYNPGFETVTGDSPTGWIEENAQNGSLQLTRSSHHSGGESASISDAQGTISTQPGWMTLPNIGAVRPGARFQASVWARGSRTTGQTVIAVAWFNSSGTYLCGNASAPLPQGYSAWTRLGVNTIAPAGAAYAEISLQSHDDVGTAWFDDVSMLVLGDHLFPPLTTVSTTSGKGPMVHNPGFEDITNGVPNSWNEVNPDNGRLRMSDLEAHSGSESVSISDSQGPISDQPAWVALLNTGALSPGMHLQGSVWAKGLNGTGQTLIAIAWFTTSGAYLGNGQSTPLSRGNTDWTKLVVNSTAPTGAGYADLSLQSYSNTGATWFDDASASVVKPH